MLTFFTYAFAFIFILIVINLLHKVVNNLEIIRHNQQDHKKQLDDRITDLRDHVRRTETSLFKAIDEKAHHLSDPILHAKLRAIEAEIESIHTLLLKMVVITDEPNTKIVKPRKPKT